MFYTRWSMTVFFIIPTLAVGWSGDQVWIEAAWLNFAVGYMP